MRRCSTRTNSSPDFFLDFFSGNAKKHRKYAHENVDNEVKCHICHKKLKGGDTALNRHLILVHDATQKKCDICGTIVKDLKKHIRAVHEKIYHKCSVCHLKYSEKRTLNEHIRSIHEGIKDVKCTDCDKYFSSNRKMTTHKRQNHGNFNCEKCGKNYSTVTGLNHHIKSFHDKIRHPCDICQKEFTIGQKPSVTNAP